MKSEERTAGVARAASMTKLVLMSMLAMSLCGCELVDMRHQHVEDRVKMHVGSSWRFDSPRDNPPAETLAIMQRYLEGKEVYLMPGSIKIIDTGLDVELHLYNKWLTCEPPFPKEGARWPCREPEFEDIVVVGDEELGLCVTKASSSGIPMPNFVGVIEKGYCIYIYVVERKQLEDEKRLASTNIKNDGLRIVITGTKGPVGPGVIIGGPRPQFRAPTVD